MNDLLLLSINSITSIAIIVGVYYLFKKTKLQNMRYWYKQILLGVFFGALCILSTEKGPSFNGSTINIRTGIVVSSSFLFGWPTGLIAAVIGATERGLSVLWNAKRAYTEIACVVSTTLAGIIAGLLRRFVLDDKKPSTMATAVVAFCIETFHMLMIFLTNMNDVKTAYETASKVVIPMIIANTLIATLTSLFIWLISKEFKNKEKSTDKISTKIQLNLFSIVSFVFVLTLIFTYFIEDNIAKSDASSLINDNITDVVKEVQTKSDSSLIHIAELVYDEVQSLGMNSKLNAKVKYDANNEHLITEQDNDLYRQLVVLQNVHEISNISLINDDGLIYCSTTKNYYAYAMDSKDQSKEFEDWFETPSDGETFAQRLMGTGENNDNKMKFAAIRCKFGGYLQVGWDEATYFNEVSKLIDGMTTFQRIGDTGRLMIAESNQKIITDRDDKAKGLYLKNVDALGFDINQLSQNTLTRIDYDETEYFMQYQIVEGYFIVGFISREEVLLNRNVLLYSTGLSEVVVFAILFMGIYLMIDGIVVRKMKIINKGLNKIAAGDLDIVVEVNNATEFIELSNDINSTVNTLKEYIDEANKRIDRELEFAKTIQMSSLPNQYSYQKGFDMHAMMRTAKEVGGDFYDFFFINETHLAFLIADVSGKGIPAAMFMMKAKTLIKSLATKGLTLGEVFTNANKELCAENEAKMFVTAWMGVLNTATGELHYVNAGHNAPLISDENGNYHYLKSKANFVLGGFDQIIYQENVITLNKEQSVFLYTDGITEATNRDKVLYGEDRLEKTLNDNKGITSKMLTSQILKDVDVFYDGEEQFDDITMLAITYLGKGETNQIVIPADKQNFEKVNMFLETNLENLLPMNKVSHLFICMDEILSNVVNYAYKDVELGTIKVILKRMETYVEIYIVDNGPEYDPLKNDDPDVTLALEDRQIGGLGIFMVKKLTDALNYYRIGKHNILVMRINY